METVGPQPTGPPVVPVPPAVTVPLPVGAHDLDMYVTHSRYRNTIQISGTMLLEFYQHARPYMEEIHRNMLVDIGVKMGYDKRLARTYHTQLAAIVKRYIPVIEHKLNELYPMEPPAYQEHLPEEQRVATCDTEVEHLGKGKRANLHLLKLAIEQAEKIEVRAKEIMDRTNEERTRGNVEFVKDIRKAGVRSWR